MILRHRGVVDRSGWDCQDPTISVPSSHRWCQLMRFDLINAHCYGLGFGRRWGCWRSRNGYKTRNTGTRGLPRFRPPEGKPYSCLSALDYGGTEGYTGAQMQSGVEVSMRKYEVRDLGRALLAFI